MSEKNTAEKATLQDRWTAGLRQWGNPSIATIVNAQEDADFTRLGAVGKSLRGQLAFMKYPEFQTFANIQNIEETFSDGDKAYSGIVAHEVGHRFCPYDQVTAFLLNNKAAQGLKEGGTKKDPATLAPEAVNLFTDICINTKLVRQGNKEIQWLYYELSQKDDKKESPLWKVYMNIYERLWNRAIRPEDAILTDAENTAAEKVAALFANRNPLDKQWWEKGIKEFSRIITPFLDQEKDNSQSRALDSSGADAVPSQEQARGMLGEIARRLAQEGTEGIPANGNAVREFREVMAGLGEGNPTRASITFYEKLAERYKVSFQKQPYGRERTSPFTLHKWSPSNPIENLAVSQSIQTGGILLPGVTTQQWRSRKSTVKGGEREVIPTLDLLIDSSGSMPNPVETVSLPVLAGFVAARRAQQRGVRVLNYSGRCQEQERTTDLHKIHEKLVLYQNGGTVFPVAEFLARQEEDPRLSLIITDTFVANLNETIDAIRSFRKRTPQNRVTIYAITNLPNAQELTRAGAECIHGTTPNIFKHVLGKTKEAYLRT